MEYGIRPRSDYLHTADWQEIYRLTETWQSDLKFFRDELQFLNNLLAKYLVLMTRQEKISTIQKISGEMGALIEHWDELDGWLQKHLKQLGILMEGALSQNQKEFRDEHHTLEEKIISFGKELKALKQEIFSITEHVLENKKAKHLLSE